MKKKIAPVIITIVVSLLIILWACTGLRGDGRPGWIFLSRIAVFAGGDRGRGRPGGSALYQTEGD